MAITQNTFTGDGSTTNYSFTFEYIKQADVKASLDGTVTTAFTLANATTLSFNTAPASGVAIRIFRDTDIDNLKATFSPGSAIKAEDLNDNFTQNNFAVQEADFDVATANTTANTAKTTADTAISTANTASTNASNAVTTANTASTNASAAVSTANTASTNASNAVTTANSASATATAADTNATTALTNSRESDGQGGFITAITKANTAVNTANTASSNASSAVTTANAASATANSATSTANSAVSTANSAASDATTAVSTANTASTNASNAVTTANSAASDATSAVSTANTASTNASNAVTTANTASTNATAALNNSRESDGQGGFTSAIDKANAAITASNTATAAVSNAVLFDLITNVSSIPGSPSNNDYIEIGNSTGIESFTPLSGLPSGFVGASGLTVRLRYDSSATSWVFMNYFANDSETRYVAIGNPNPTYYANQAAFPSATTYHGGVAHSHADGAMYYAHGGNWIKMAKDSDVVAKLPLAGGTLTGDLTLNGAPTTTNMAATKGYVDTEVAGLVDSAPGTLDTLNELAAALGDDANFSTTVTNSIATKMPLAGGTFSGNVEIGTGIDLNTNGSATFAGNVGIGTSSPTSYGNSQPTLVVEGSTNPAICWSDTGQTRDWWAVANGSNLSFNYADGGGSGSASNVTTALSMTNAGSVGIGTTSPSFPSGTGLAIHHSTASRFKLTNDTTGTGASDGAHLYTSGGDFIIENKESAHMRFYTAGSERMRLGSDGKLLIGSTSGSAHGDRLLQVGRTDRSETYISIVNSTAGSGALLFADTTSNDTGGYRGQVVYSHANDSMRFWTSATERMRIDSSGNVLINTTTLPTSDSKLTVQNSGSSCEFNVISGSSNGSVVNMGDTDDYNDGRIKYDNSSRSMQFQTANAERMRIDSSGRFAIGNTTPSSFTGNGADNLVVGSGSGDEGIAVYSGSSNQGSITFADGTSGDATYRGAVEYNHSNDKLQFRAGGVANRATIDSSGNATFNGTVSDSIGSLRRVGIHTASANFTLTTDHPGKLVRMSGSGKTIAVPQNVLSAGDMVTMFNVSTGDMTIEQGTGTTIYNSADGATGNRTVAAKGMVTLVCTASNEFVITGSQLS